MKISFIVPAYNEQKSLGKTLQAILDETSQHKDLDTEIIVVNNASTDNTKNVALAFQNVKVVDEHQKGLVFARAAGATAATGDLLAHVDADCLLPKGWLQIVIDEFSKDEKLVALSGPQFYYDVYHTLNWFEKMIVDVYHTIYYWVYLLNNNVLHVGSIVQGGNFIVRSWAWNKMAPANPEYNFYGEDADIARRLYKLGGVKFNPKLTIHASGRRLKEEGLVKTGGLYVINYFSVLFFKKPATKKYSDVRVA